MSGPKSETLSLKINGLYTQPNTFSEVPEGITLALANNIVIDRDSIIGSRRGFAQYGVEPDGTLILKSIFDFKDTLIIHDEAGSLKFDAGNGLAWTEYAGGPYFAPGSLAGDRIASFQQNKNLFLTTSNGIYKLESAAATPRTAGVSAGLGGSGASIGASGFQAPSTNVAYRIIWGYRDANANLILGAPSDRIIVSNTSAGDRDVTLTFFIPADINTTYFYQVYRSAQTIGLTTEPDDELQLIEENVPSPAQITAGLVTFTDSTPDNLRSVLIYTAASLTTGGILNANTQPPLAKTACTFKNFAFYGNTRTKQTLEATLIAAGAPDGIQIGDTVTFTETGAGFFTITAAAAENAAAGQFKVQTSLTPAENIDETARSIVNVLNTVATNTLFAAYYISGYQELPGRMRFERLSLDPDTFFINSTRPSAFRPIGSTVGSTYNNTSRNEELQNRVYFSKLQQPEAVPILQFFDIGSSEESIEALVPLRDGIIVLKRDGVFRISGTSASTFQVNPIDTTVNILAKQSVAVLNNKVYFYSTQGVVAVSDNSAALVSRPIETQLLELSSALYPNFANVTFARAYESDRKYILWVPTTSAETQASQAFVYNTLTNAWTRWTKQGSCAIVKQEDDKLYICGPAAGTLENFVFQERKNFALTDYADEQYDITIVGAAGTSITVSSTANLEPGYTIQQTLLSSRIVSVNSSTNLTLESVEDWDLAPAIAYRPIFQSFQTNQLDAGNPGSMKHWADCSAIFRATTFDTLIVGFEADTTNEVKNVTIVAPPGTGGWGTFPWGTLPWGVSTATKARLRMSVPQQAQRSNWLLLSMSLAECFTDISLAGVSLTYTKMSSRQKGASRA